MNAKDVHNIVNVIIDLLLPTMQMGVQRNPMCLERWVEGM